MVEHFHEWLGLVSLAISAPLKSSLRNTTARSTLDYPIRISTFVHLADVY